MPVPLTQPASCPDSDALLQLISGSMNEAAAEALFQHVDLCERCQQRLDELERRQHRLPAKPDDEEPRVSHVDRLISKARQLPSAAEEAPPREAVSVDGFVKGLRRCGLFDELAISEVLSNVSSTSSGSMARELVAQGQLTAFQARVLLKGRWKGLVLGNYEILDKLGQGGMGSVFKARHRRLGRVVCVKVVNSAGRRSPKMLERFRNEARTVAALSHPNFVVAHDADEAEGVPFLVMEYMDGIDLSKQVERTGPLPLFDALTVTQQVAVAMQYAHDQGVTHRDIKPHNLLVTEDSETGERQIKILDLGLARFDTLLGESIDASQHVAATNTGVIMGTVDYMSPEQALRSRDADGRSDIYSLGCTMHFLLTGEPVFAGDTMMARLVAHREAEVPSIEQQCPGAPPGLDAIFRRMLAKDPEQRYQSMTELADDLDLLISGGVPVAVSGDAVSTTVTAMLQRRRSRSSRGRAVGVVLAVVAFLLVTAGGLAWKFRPAATSLWNTSESLTTPQSQATGGPRTVPAWTAETSEEVGELMARPAVAALIGDPQLIHFGEHPTLEFRGVPEAVVVLPQSEFDDRQYDRLAKALEAAGIHMRVAAPQMNPLHPKHDKDLQLYPDTTIANLKASDFDLLFIVDGSLQDFQKKEIRHDLASLFSSSTGMQRVLGATSQKAYGVLAESGVVNGDRTPHKLNSVLFGRLSVSNSPLVYASEPDGIDAMVQRAVSMRLASVQPGLHRSALTAYGNGRALVVLPMKEFSANDYLFLKRALDEQGIEQVVTSVVAAREAVSADGKLRVPVKLSLDEVSANLQALTKNLPFEYLYDYVFVIGSKDNSLTADASGELQQLLRLAVTGRGTVVGISEHSRSALALSSALDTSDLAPDQDGQVRETAEGAVYAIKTDCSNQQQMNAFCRQLQKRRRAAVIQRPLSL